MKTVWSGEATHLFALLGDKPVAYHPVLARVFGIETSLVFVQALYCQSEAEARGAQWWAYRHTEFADRLGFSPDQLRRHLRPLTDPVTLDRRALLRARVTGFGRQKATEYQLDVALATGYIRAQLPAVAPPKVAPPKWRNHQNESGETTRMDRLKEGDKGRAEESVCVNARARADEAQAHPAVMAFWEASGRRFWPQAGLIPAIVREVGEDPERVALFQAIQARRLERGEMLMNVERAFAYLRTGQLPPPARIETGGSRADAQIDLEAAIRQAADL